MREVGVRQFKNEASALLERVERGETLTITRRGKPVAHVVPVEGADEWTGLVDAGVIRWSGRKVEIPRALPLTGDGPSAADIVIEARGPR